MLSPSRTRALDRWRERIRALSLERDGERLTSRTERELLGIAKRVRISERAYSATMANLLARPDALPRLVLEQMWTMVAAEQNGNVIG